MRYLTSSLARIVPYLALAVILAACSEDASTGPDGHSQSRQIAFSGGAGDLSGVYVVQSDGTELTLLIGGAGFPQWSPDGLQLAFLRAVNGNPQVYRMNGDGSDSTRLTDVGFNHGPRWSPDGSRIAFMSFRDGDLEIFLVNADGTGEIQLTDNNTSDVLPDWSPDGSQIAFVSNRDGVSKIYVMNADGTGATVLSDLEFVDVDGRAFVRPHDFWSPNGSRVAFVSDSDGDADIYVVNVDGSGLINLSNNAVDDLNPSWSPDGTRIAFESRQGARSDIYVVAADGTGVTPLTSDSGFNSGAAWSPDGLQIAFLSDRAAGVHLYLMDADGTDVTRITSITAVDQPRWRP